MKRYPSASGIETSIQCLALDHVYVFLILVELSVLLHILDIHIWSLSNLNMFSPKYENIFWSNQSPYSLNVP
jgi:hypothetical protein